MDFVLHILSDREILQGDSGYHYDSKIMGQRGQDYQAKKTEIENNPEHTVTLYVPPVE